MQAGREGMRRQHQVELTSPVDGMAEQGINAGAPARSLRRVAQALFLGRGWWGIMVPLVGIGLLLGETLWQILTVGEYTDAARYQCYAMAFWHGAAALPGLTAMQHCQFLVPYATAAPFHTLPLEYPLLTLVPFSLALLAPASLYQVAFALWMGVVALVVYALLQRFGPRGAGFLFIAYLVIGGWATAEARFDLLPAALTLGSLIAATRGRWRWAYTLLALATMLKFYPIVLLPALFIAEQRELRLHWRAARRLTGVALFAGTCVGLTLLSLALSVPGTLAPLTYFGVRPVQIESVAATLVWFTHLAGAPSSYNFTFGSLNVLNPWDRIVSDVFTVALLAGFVAILLAQLRGRLDLGAAYLATLLLIIVTGKVFSPQYLLWLAPLVAYMTARDWRWFLLWGVICLLTTIVYPYLYEVSAYIYPTIDRNLPILKAPDVPGFLPAIAARDLLFLLVTMGYCFDVGGLRRGWARTRRLDASSEGRTSLNAGSVAGR
jgi:hypothetical protein